VTHEDIAAWEGFAVALVGAAAVLSGLLFVAVSLNMERILRIRTLPGRAGESVILFLGVLVECAYLLIPSQSETALAIELVVTGVVIAGVLLAIVVPATRIRTQIPRSWHVTRYVVVLGSTVPVILAGFAVLGGLPGGLNWLAFAVLFALCAATSNAWVLLVEVVRDKRYSPID
jgi:modulator of FtsH protease